MPGKQDVVAIWDENDDKHKQQNRILTMTIGETYSLLMKILMLPLRKVNLQN